MPANFEGGRQPLVRQLPKNRGFRAVHPKAIAVSLSRLNVFNDGENVTAKSLQEKGIIKPMLSLANTDVKILGGEIKKKLQFSVRVSAQAKAAIEKAGGTIKS